MERSVWQVRTRHAEVKRGIASPSKGFTCARNVVRFFAQVASLAFVRVRDERNAGRSDVGGDRSVARGIPQT
eukprot:598475-Prorocentrum_minimum.AAC.1